LLAVRDYCGAVQAKGRTMDGMTALTLTDKPHGQRAAHAFGFETVIDEICGMAWDRLTNDEVLQVAKAYYYFSIQFRENLEIACMRRPGDRKLASLRQGECDTANLSPWPEVAAPGEKMNHDEFMRRLLALQDVPDAGYIEALGASYLSRVRSVDDLPRACSIASYEDGGLARVFAAMLRAPHWHGAGQSAFRFFLEEHIRFDTDAELGHGSLSRHLAPTDAILPLWSAFAALLTASVPRLISGEDREARQPLLLWPVTALSR
jgi:hypothetical protein